MLYVGIAQRQCLCLCMICLCICRFRASHIDVLHQVLRNTNHEKRQLQETLICLSIFGITRM